MYEKLLKRLKIPGPALLTEVGPGWLPVVEQAFEKMIDAGWNKELFQVKQKFRQLRIYIGTTNPEIDKAIAEAEKICDTLCEQCGGEREDKGYGWGRAVCDECKKGP